MDLVPGLKQGALKAPMAPDPMMAICKAHGVPRWVAAGGQKPRPRHENARPWQSPREASCEPNQRASRGPTPQTQTQGHEAKHHDPGPNAPSPPT